MNKDDDSGEMCAKARWRKNVSKALKLEKSRKFATHRPKSLSYKSCQSRTWRRRHQKDNLRHARRELNNSVRGGEGALEALTASSAPFVADFLVHMGEPQHLSKDERRKMRGPNAYPGREIRHWRGT